MKLFIPSTLLLLLGVDAIKQDQVIIRDSQLSGAPLNFKLEKQDTKMVHMVEPLPLDTLVQTLFKHSKTPRDEFIDYYERAIKGQSHLMGIHSYAYLAQARLNVMLQDYLPMNEADMASAIFMFGIPECKLVKESKIPASLTACQYHGASFLADIVHRLMPIHNILTFGAVVPVPNKNLKPVPLIVPTEWNEQVARIISNLNTPTVMASLQAVDPAAAAIWQDIISRSMPKSN